MKAEPRAGARGLARPESWLAPLLVLVVVLLYAATARHAFLSYDDDDYITANPHVASGLSWANLRWAFSAFHSSNWHPLTWISHQLDAQLFGLASGATHLVNVALHALNTLLCFAFLRRATGAPWAAGLTALVFAVHPQRVESVAWAAERKDLLAGTFFFLTLLAYLRYARAPSAGRMLLVALSLALGLLAKPMLVTLPLVLLLLDLWPLGRLACAPDVCDGSAFRRRARGLVLEKVPLFALALASGLVTLAAQGTSGAIRSLTDLSLAARLAGAAQGLALTLGQALWPARLCVFYPHPALLAGAPFAALGARTALAAGLLLASTLGAWLLRKRLPMLAVGWAWFLVMMLPVCGLLQVGLQLHADRYAYLPLVGPTLALVYGARAALPAWALRPAYGAGLLLAALYAGVTLRQVGTWKDTRTLCEHALRVSTQNFVAHEHLALELQQAGELEGARAHYRAAIAAAPDLPGAHGNLAALEAQLGDWTAAEAEFEILARLAPESIQARLGLAALALRAGDAPRVLAILDGLDEREPAFPLVLIDRAAAHEQCGEWSAALECYERSFALAPPDAEAACAAAWILATGPDPDSIDGARALPLAERALAGGAVRAKEVLAAVQARLGDFEAAERLQAEAGAAAQSATERFLLEERRALYHAHQAYTRPR